MGGNKTRRPNVISKRHCPYTGVVNFFATADPFIAVGSVSETATPPHYAWRCYLDDPVGGTAPDLAIAEMALKKAIASRRRLAPAL
jgi:hypothetical protein